MRTYFEHLNECNAEIEVGFVAKDQTETEEETNWQDSAKVDLTGHLVLFPTIEKRCGSRQKLCHACCDKHVPCRENDSFLPVSTRLTGAIYLFLRNPMSVSEVAVLRHR
jgi:hypothetical protein